MRKNLNILISGVIKALSYLERNQKQTLDLLKETAQIPSPTFCEKEKITFLRDKLLKLGFHNIYIDKQGNCRGKIIPLKSARKKILVVAHADTVLKPEKEIRETKNHLFGHGVCDNTTGVVALLTILYLIRKFKISLPVQLYFAFTVQEEGLGGKKGMRFIINQLKNIDAVINLESHNIGRITNQAIGQYRAKIYIETEKNGHSWRDFGNPNANVILSSLISRFAKISSFQKKKLTFNIGKIKGGEGINIIAKKAHSLWEIRALNQEDLDISKNKLQEIIKKISHEYRGVKIRVELLSESKAAFFAKTHKIYKLTQEVHRFLGIKSFFDSGNNDGDISLAKGIPTVTLGSSFGFKTHSLKEYLEKKSLILGIKQNLLVLLNVLDSL